VPQATFPDCWFVTAKPFPGRHPAGSLIKSREEFVHVNGDASVRGRLSQLLASIIGFSFIRSIAARAHAGESVLLPD
jgi:hypothetical protein